jgi:hypothetical protein
MSSNVYLDWSSAMNAPRIKVVTPLKEKRLLVTLKLILVVAIWVLGPVIDSVVELKFRKLAPASGETASPEFIRILKQYLTLEVMATGLFYVIIIMWVLV